MKRILMLLMMSISVATLAQEKGNLPLPTSGDVTLPLDEYNKLTELASKSAVKPEVPPIPYSIKRAAMKLRVTSESVSGKVQCDGEVLAKGATRIPLVSAPAVLDASLAGKALPLQQEDGMQTAILSGPAEFSILFDMGIPLSIEAGRASFNLPVPMAGSTQLSLEIPGEHTNVKINPGLITGRSSDAGRTLIEATLVPGQNANVWWTTREIAAPVVPREVRFLSSIKTLVSVGEADLRLAVLADITVVQGEPTQFEVAMPAGYEMTGVTGASLESEEMRSGILFLKLAGAAKRNYQFLISLEKPISDAKADVPFLVIKGTQREAGEVLVEGEGTMELSAAEGGTLKRMDLKEVNAYLRSLARYPLHGAFRYHRQSSEPPTLALTWNRFPDSSVLSAAAERAEVTTLITSEGRSLTEVKLTLRNQAQPFLKVGLPAGASILTCDVAGEKVKPVQGADGIRVPLLPRSGFRPLGSYRVAFVLMHAGTPFAKKGDAELNLPKMDIPICFLHWEVFLPDTYKIKDFGGDAISTHLVPYSLTPPEIDTTYSASRWPAGENSMVVVEAASVNDVRWPAGINEASPGSYRAVPQKVEISPAQASANVVDLQRRAAGVLPISVDVPRAGNSYRFVRPLVLDEETRVTFKYKSK